MDVSPRLLSLWKPIVLGVLISSLVAAVPPAQARAEDAEVWDMEFGGKGDPRDVGFKLLLNSSSFNFYDKFSSIDVMPGWMTASGNPGSFFYKGSGEGKHPGRWLDS